MSCTFSRAVSNLFLPLTYPVTLAASLYKYSAISCPWYPYSLATRLINLLPDCVALADPLKDFGKRNLFSIDEEIHVLPIKTYA
jgi:hypothetical protein